MPSNQRTRGPNFLIPGAPRSMTSALVYYLEEHPDVCFGRVKEINYFTKYHDKGTDWYLEFFRGCATEAAVGEASTRYMSEPNAAERILNFNPAMRLIFVLRDPVQRAYSEYKRDIQTRGFDERFDTLVRESDRYIWPGRYSTHLRRFVEWFPQDQMMLVLFDELSSEPRSQLERICGFLSVEQGFRFSRLGNNTINRSYYPRSLWLQRWIGEHLRHSYYDPVIFRYVKNVVRRFLLSINRTTDQTSFAPMRPETRTYLREIFAPEIEELERMFSLDLSRWCSTESEA